MNTHEKVRENRIRRAARRQGLLLVKSRRRDPRAVAFGRYVLVDYKPGNYGGSRRRHSGQAAVNEFFNTGGFTLDAIEKELEI